MGSTRESYDSELDPVFPTLGKDYESMGIKGIRKYSEHSKSITFRI